MSAAPVHERATAANALEAALAPSANGGRASAALLIAVLAHAALAALALNQKPSQSHIVDVTEIEFMPPKVEPPPPLPMEEPKPAALAKAEPVARVRARAPSKLSPPASAAPLRTIEEAVATSDEPVRFVTDPNGSAFGYGTVARGGTAAAASGPVAAGAPAPVAAVASAAPLLSRPPRLAESDPCRGFFPSLARVDRGEVALKVRVERDGSVRSITVVSEAPLGNGFGFAARDCLRTKRFSPALDRMGQEVAVVSPITVRFKR